MHARNRSAHPKSVALTLMVLLVSLIIVMLLCSTALAATIYITAAYPSFTATSINDWSLVGDAARYATTNSLRLTRNTTNLYGAGWWEPRTSLIDEGSFSMAFRFLMRDQGGGGADGLTFAIQPNSSAEGSPGQGLGYGGIPNSFAVEFDTWQNTDEGDPDANHIGIDLDGPLQSVQTATPPATLESTTTWWAWIDYDGLNDKLESYILRQNTSTPTRPATPVLTSTIDLYSHYGDSVFFGFTAATGAAYQNHYIRSVYFNNGYLPGGIDLDNNTYLQSPAYVDVTAVPGTIVADGTSQSTITATVQDLNHNPVGAGYTVDFTTTLGTVVPASGVTNASGQVTTQLSGNSPGVATVRARVTPGNAYEAL